MKEKTKDILVIVFVMSLFTCQLLYYELVFYPSILEREARIQTLWYKGHSEYWTQNQRDTGSNLIYYGVFFSVQTMLSILLIKRVKRID